MFLSHYMVLRGYYPQPMPRGLPVSRNDFRLDSTRGHPFVMPRRVSDPGSSSSCVTVRRTRSPSVSMSMVIREDLELSASATLDQVRTRRLFVMSSTTLPTTLTVLFPSSATSCHLLPGFQSDTFSCIQYWRVSSPSMSACQTFSGVVAM